MTALAWVAVWGCKEPEPETRELDPLLPFPSARSMSAGRVALPQGLLPVGLGGTPFPVERLAWRRGFSPVQTTVLDLGPDLDPATLPGPSGEGAPDSIQLWDLTDGVRLGAWAELDAYPVMDVEHPTVLVRPLAPMPMGHEVAVVVGPDVRRKDGGAPDTAWYQAAVAGEPTSDEAYAAALRDLQERLGAVGAPSDAVLATSFPVDDPRSALRSMVAAQAVPTRWSFERTEDVLEGDLLPAGLWKRASGTFDTTTWLEDDTQFVWSEDLPTPLGEAEVDLFVYLPESIQNAAPGTVPVWIFGHGIFSDPDRYLDDGDPSGVIELANQAGVVVVATVWRGLTYGDLPIAAQVGGDFGRLPEITDKLAQGVANVRAMTLLATQGSLMDDPFFESKIDRSTVRYFGISLGGIEGATLLANTPEIPFGVLHVGGSAWSFMLERSSNWPTFEDLVVAGIESPRERQALYAASQLFWDEADPAVFAQDLGARADLWQMSLGDEQVPNRSTELLARGTGAVVVLPAEGMAADLATSGVPLDGPALAVYDPELGLPTDVNRPAPESGAHAAPRHWAGMRAQTIRFLDPVEPGVVEHYCGDTMCSASHPGD